MNAYSLLLAKSLMSLAVSGAVLYVLPPPLTKVLHRICPDEESALFWSSYTKIMLMITPLLLVLTADLLTRASDPMYSLRFAMMAALIGVLIGLHSIGQRMGKFVITPQQPERLHHESITFDTGVEK